MSTLIDKLDHEALDEARGILGVRRDVIARTSLFADCERTLGRYAGIDPFHGFHTCLLRHSMTVDLAHAMLVHEMVHAAQAEREGSWHRFNGEYDRQLVEAGLDPRGPRDDHYWRVYRTIPFEREAYYCQRRAWELPWLFGDPDRRKT